MRLLITYTTGTQITEDGYTRIVHRKVYPASTIIESAVKDFITRFGLERNGNILSGIELALCED